MMFTEDQFEQARIINVSALGVNVSALGDCVFRVVCPVRRKKAEMMKKYDARYSSNSVDRSVSKFSEIVLIRFMSIESDLAKHVDRLAGLIDKLRGIGTMFGGQLAKGIFVSSIDVEHLLPACAAIKTLVYKDLSRGYVSSRLIDEVSLI